MYMGHNEMIGSQAFGQHVKVIPTSDPAFAGSFRRAFQP
jgi:hypothetical protein